MNISVESIFPSYKPKEMPTEELRFLLKTITTQLPVEVACIYEYHEVTKQIESVVSEQFAPFSPQKQDRICTQLAERFTKSLPSTEAQIIPIDALAGDTQQSALLYPFTITDTIIGVLALFSSGASSYD